MRLNRKFPELPGFWGVIYMFDIKLGLPFQVPNPLLSHLLFAIRTGLGDGVLTAQLSSSAT